MNIKLLFFHIFLSLSLIVAILFFFPNYLIPFYCFSTSNFPTSGLCKLTQVKLATPSAKGEPKATTPILESSPTNLVMVLLIIHWMDSFESHGWCQHF